MHELARRIDEAATVPNCDPEPKLVLRRTDFADLTMLGSHRQGVGSEPGSISIRNCQSLWLQLRTG